MKRLLSVIVVWIMLLLPSMAQVQATQTIRGQVSDVASGEPMAGVSIQVENGTTSQTMTDMAGNFVINNVPVGRHAVRATYVGYEPVLIKELLLSASKELVLSLSMRGELPCMLMPLVAPPDIMPANTDAVRAGSASPPA